MTGANINRPELQKALAALKPGDTLIVWKLDRLGRSLTDLISILDSLKAKGVEFQSIKEKIDTSSAAGRLLWMMIGAFAEFERSMIRERVMSGQARAKANGVAFGRKWKLNDDQVRQAAKMRADGDEYAHICSVFKVGRTTLIRSLKKGLRPLKEGKAQR